MKPAGRSLAACALALALAACATSQRAPVVERSGARPATPAAPVPPSTPAATVARPQAAADGTYTVRRGDTLYAIALEHGVDYRELAQWNSLEDPSRILVGQVLRVRPPEDRPVAQAAPARGAGRVEARPIEARPAEPERAARAEPNERAARAEPKPEPARTEPPKPEPARPDPARAEPAGVMQTAEFIWPVKGKVLAGFAEPRSKGIDIDGKPGDPVVAAAAGRVTYVGSGIPGLGKLVVLRHDNGFITVYAHNREILVKEQQAVARGQRIAELGATDADRPKLHFQIRKGAAAVDPLKFLPAT